MLVSSLPPRALQTIGCKSRGSPLAYLSQLSRVFLLFCQVKPLAKEDNFFGQQLPTLLADTCCVRLYTLLHVVARAQSLKPVKLLSQQLPTFSFVSWSSKRSATILDPYVCAAFPTLLKPRTRITHCLQSYRSYPSHDALQVATLLGVVASFCTPNIPSHLPLVDAYPPLRSPYLKW